ncbi:MAG: hypothetical protein WAN51_10760, partial [Alphaproteobacteria bacterium]
MSKITNHDPTAPKTGCRPMGRSFVEISNGKSARVYQWSSGDCRFGMSDGQNESCSGPQVGFEEIAIDLLQGRFRPTSCWRDDTSRIAASACNVLHRVQLRARMALSPGTKLGPYEI